MDDEGILGPTENMRRLFLVGLLALPLSGALTQESPTFRAHTQVVQMNVAVRDKNGPVGDLTKGQFEISDNGKRRTVSIFSVNKARFAAGAPALAENTFSNRLVNSDSPSNVTMIRVDRLNTMMGTSDPGELEDRPILVEGQRRVRLVSVEHQTDGAAGGAEGRIGQRPFRIE